MKSTVMRRKCKKCGYYKDHNLYGPGIGWCYWLGQKRLGRSEDCEDGFIDKKEYHEQRR